MLDAIANVTEAMWLPFKDGSAKHAWKLHVHFDFDLFLPGDVELSDARNSGKSNEKQVLRARLAKDRCYVMDRWYGQFKLFNDINAKASSYVCRVKENSVFEVEQERLLSDEALKAGKAGVVRDVVVRMGIKSKPAAKPDHPMRIVVIEA